MLLRALWFAILLHVATAHAAIVDRVAAVVNDDVITLSEVYALGGDYIEKQTAAAEGDPVARRKAELEVLDSLIQRKLIEQEIDKLDISVSDEELDRTIDGIARRNALDRDKLKAEVVKSGMSWHEYKAELRQNLEQQKFTQAVIYPRISVNEDELKDAWHKMQQKLPQVVNLGAIFLAFPKEPDSAAIQAVIDKAEAALARLESGEPFEKVATEVGEGQYAARGGHMGTYREGELVEALDGPAFSLSVGATSDPIITEQGVFLLHVFSRKREELPAYDQVREKLFNEVYAQRIDDELKQWTEQARRQAAVGVKLASPPNQP